MRKTCKLLALLLIGVLIFGANASAQFLNSLSASNLATTSATISWTSCSPSTSQVEWGTTTAYGNLTAVNTSLVTAHSVALSGLTASTAYHYRVHSIDAAGIEVTSTDFTFTTPASVSTTTTVVNFDNPRCPAGSSGATLTGSFGGISWGSGPWDCEISSIDGTISVSWDQNVTKATFSFASPSVLTSLEAGSSSGNGTLTIASDQGESFSRSLTGGATIATIATGFTKPATLITVSFTGGWTLELDNITYQTTTVAAIQHTVSLAWNASTSTVAGYNVYRGTTSGGPYSKLTGTLLSSLAYSDSSVTSGKTYYYVTTAVDSTGAESGYSNQAQAVIPFP